MRLLVSIASAEEAAAAMAGGADIIDAKDPRAGALGAVSPRVLAEIFRAVAGTHPVSAALGDAVDEGDVERDACTFAAAGAVFVKLGFGGITSGRRVGTLTAAAVRGAIKGSDGRTGVVAVAYADAERVWSFPAGDLVALVAAAGAKGVLLDTGDKAGPSLRGLMTPGDLCAWTAEAHQAGLFVALAGKLTADDLSFVRDGGAEIAGVRGAACDGGRVGRVSATKVRLLRALCDPATAGDCGRGRLSDPREQSLT